MKALGSVLGLLSILCSAPEFAYGKTANSLSAAADLLAEQFVKRLDIDGNQIAVGLTAFPHIDDSCSELSNFFHDELLFQIFNYSGKHVSVVERTQLNQVFAELEFQQQGDIDKSTATEIGKILGVDGIVIGSLVDLGDRIRVNGRLITTETGAVTSVARTEFPETDTISGLMERSSTGSCGFGIRTGTLGPEAGPNPRFEKAAYSSDAFNASIIQVSRSADKKTISVVVRFGNTADAEIGLSYVQDTLAVIGNNGEGYEMGDVWSGIRACRATYSSCTPRYPRYATSIKPGKHAQLVFNVVSDDAMSANAVTITMELIVTPDAANAEYSVVNVGFFDVPVVE